MNANICKDNNLLSDLLLDKVKLSFGFYDEKGRLG